MKIKYCLLVGVIGFIIGGSLIPIDAAIPPTPAYPSINSETDNKTTTSRAWDDTVYFVGNGTVITQYIEQAVGWCDSNYTYSFLF